MKIFSNLGIAEVTFILLITHNLGDRCWWLCFRAWHSSPVLRRLIFTIVQDSLLQLRQRPTHLVLMYFSNVARHAICRNIG